MTENCSSCGNETNKTRCPSCLSRVNPQYNSAVDSYYTMSSISDDNKHQYLKEATFRDKVNDVCDLLERKAEEQDPITYGKIMDKKGVHRARIAYVLGAISSIESSSDNDDEVRPLLSAIAVNSSDKTPSEGFYGLSEGLENVEQDVSAMSKSERLEWWEFEKKKVYNYFSGA